MSGITCDYCSDWLPAIRKFMAKETGQDISDEWNCCSNIVHFNELLKVLGGTDIVWDTCDPEKKGVWDAKIWVGEDSVKYSEWGDTPAHAIMHALCCALPHEYFL